MTSDGGASGESVPRVEDEAILSGDAEYVHDVEQPGMLYAEMVRSDEAHARLLETDTGPAAATDGVVTVLDGTDVLDRTRAFGAETSGLSCPDRTVFAADRIRFQGEPVAVVAAETREAATEGAAAVRTTVDPLPAVPDLESAEDCPPAAYLHPELAREDDAVDGNVWGEFTFGIGDVDGAFDRANHVVSETYTTSRPTNVPLGTQGVVADYDPAADRLTLRTNTQEAFTVRQLLSLLVDDAPPLNRIRVTRPPNVGGGFGSKNGLGIHQVAAALLALEVERPVKLCLDRAAEFETVGVRQRQRHEMSLAIDDDGTFLAFRDDVLAESGAYTSLARTSLRLSAGLLAAPYDVDAARLSGRGVFTNTVTEIPYRGYGMTRISTVREMLVSKAASVLGMNEWELRRRNTRADEDCPYRHPIGFHVDSSGLHECLDRARSAIDDALLDDGTGHAVRRGLGVAAGIIPTGHSGDGPPPDLNAATVVLQPDGTVSVRTDLCPVGAGTATTLSRLVSSELHVPYDDVEFTFGDTDAVPYGDGTGKSHGTALGGAAVREAAEDIRRTLLSVAAHQLDAPVDDLVLGEETVAVRGDPETAVPRGKLRYDLYHESSALPDGLTCGELRATASMESQAEGVLDGDGARRDSGLTYAFDAHAAIVEVDVETGHVRVLDYAIAEDVGRVLHPASVRGQLQGGVVQGVAMTLGETLAYDDDGTLLTDDLQRYPVPRFDGTHRVTNVDLVETEPERSPLGVKGAGENGAVVSPAAVANAINDALDASITRFPFDQERVYFAANEG